VGVDHLDNVKKNKWLLDYSDGRQKLIDIANNNVDIGLRITRYGRKTFGGRAC
jgi:aminopeptidase-like protein